MVILKQLINWLQSWLLTLCIIHNRLISDLATIQLQTDVNTAGASPNDMKMRNMLLFHSISHDVQAYVFLVLDDMYMTSDLFYIFVGQTIYSYIGSQLHFFLHLDINNYRDFINIGFSYLCIAIQCIAIYCNIAVTGF